MAEAVAAPVTLDALVDKYIQLRDKKTELESAHKKRIAEYDAALTRLENHFLKHLQDSGSESVRTAAGTFFKTTKNSAPVDDWDAVSAWIKEDPDERWAILEKRVSKGFVEAYKEAHNDDLPPGINWRSETAVNVRRS